MTITLRTGKGRIRAELTRQNGEVLAGVSDTFSGALRNLAAETASGKIEADLLTELIKSERG